jgi:hypothetical protein
MGLCPDELGYLVPGYDFLPPNVDPAGPAIHQAEDACVTERRASHYHETNSASSNLAARLGVRCSLVAGRSCSGHRILPGREKYMH